MEFEVRLVSLQRFDPLRPELHAPAAQPPAPPAAAAKDMAHQHPEGCRCSTQIICRSLAINGLVQARVVNRNIVPLLGQMPGGAEADGPGTNHSNGAAQLKASAGMRSL